MNKVPKICGFYRMYRRGETTLAGTCAFMPAFRRGFSLVELMTVVSVIALLMSITMPTVNMVKSQAIKVVCQAKLKTWGPAFASYAAANEGRFPPGLLNYEFDDNAQRQSLWIGALGNTNSEAMRCPATSKINTSDAVKGVWAYKKGVTTGLIKGDYGSYCMNGWADSIVPQINGMSHPFLGYYWQKADAVKSAVKVPLLLDGAYIFGLPKQYDKPPVLSGVFDGKSDMQRFCVPRHGGAVNSLFMDSSVRSVGVKELWNLKWNRNYDSAFPRPRWYPWMAAYK